MALVAINPVQQQPKVSALDKIASALQIAQGVLGTALEIPKYKMAKEQAAQQAKLGEQELAQKKVETAISLAKMHRLTPEEKARGLAGVAVPGFEGEYMAKEEPKDLKSELEAGELKRKLRNLDQNELEQFKKDYPGSKYVPATVGDKEDFEKTLTLSGFKETQDREAKREQSVNDYRKQIEDKQKNLEARYPFYIQIVQEEGKPKSTAGDQNLLISYAKFLNPNLRGEGLEAIENDPGLSKMGVFKQSIENIAQNKTIDDVYRKEIFDKTHSYWAAHIGASKKLTDQIVNNAIKEGIDPGRIILNYEDVRAASEISQEDIQKELKKRGLSK